MTNEIKELIDIIKKIIEENRKNDFNHIILQSTSMEQLLDYITNLQEENEKLKDDKDGWHLVAQRNYNELLDRIDKAIEYIEENTTKEYEVPLIDSFSISYQKLVDILRGDE